MKYTQRELRNTKKALLRRIERQVEVEEERKFRLTNPFISDIDIFKNRKKTKLHLHEKNKRSKGRD